MATTSVILDIRANTQRALSEFKTFSSQLDNKFLVSGLKLDVVRSALSQINREFQRSMGEQGLVSSQSLKAAENQASLLTNIYTGFSKTASARITEDFSKALSEVAVRTGGTVSDIQKSLSISPFLSRSFSRQDRGAILGDLQRIQTFASQAGLGNNAADIFKKIATGQTSSAELESSDDSLSKVIGARLRDVAPVADLSAVSIEERTRILQNLVKSLDVKELEELAKETGGFRVVLAKFSASLFNPKVGIFGAMKEFTLSTGEAPTTIFKETTKLFESIFGEQGFIKTLGRELAKAFGIRGEDAAVKFLGRGIRFITNLIKSVTDLIDDVLNNPIIKGIVGIIRSAFDGIVRFIGKLNDIAKNPPEMPDVSPESIQRFIREIGESIRGFLKKVGATIRGEDISDEAKTGSSIIGTVIDEAGKTILTFFKEVGDALLAKTGTIALELAKVLPGTIAGIIGAGLSGKGGLSGFILSALGAGGLGLGALGLARGGTQFVGQGVRQYRRAGIRGSAMEYFFGRGGFGSSGGRRGGGGGGGGGSDIPPGLDDLLSSIRDEEELTQKKRGLRDRIRDQYTRVTAPRSQWPRPGTDLELLQRRKAISEGRITASTSVLAGTIDELISPEDILKRSTVPRGKITPKTTMFTPQVYSSQYLTPAGPLPHDSVEPWTMVDGEYQPFMGEVNPEFAAEEERKRKLNLEQKNFSKYYKEAELNRKARSRQSIRQRFSQRYGRRALLGAQAKRLVPKIRGFGKGALIAGGAAALLGLGNLITGDDAQAAEFDPATGQFIQPQRPQVGAGQAWGAVGMGAAEGAMTGAMFGPWGAAIGGVIGGGIALMDKGVRDAVVKSIGDFGSSIWKNLTEAATGFKKAIFSGLDVVKKWASDIDWKNILLDIVFPGRGLIRTGLEAMGIKKEEDKDRGFLDNVKNFFLDLFGVKGDEPRREVGGPVTKGVTYRVGERGPELFTPGQAGSIITNRELNALSSRSASGGSPNVTFNVTINATGLAGNDIATAIKPAVIKILDDGMKQISSSTVTRGVTVI